MRLEEAYRKLPEFMDGGLPDVERREMERLLDQEPALAQAFHVSQQIDDCLTRQPWLEPSPLFVQKVLAHTELAGSRLL
ncbi:hypothetical protein KJ815_00345, partial [bacterium]|nr:hypothetical protein [bacterium]